MSSRFINPRIISTWTKFRAPLLVLFIILFDPFGLNSVSDQASSNTINRIKSFSYANIGQKEIVVVLIDDQFLEANNLRWPLPYNEQATLLKRILLYKPAALFVDLIYSHDRSNDTDSINDIVRTFTRFQNASNTRVLLANSGSQQSVVAALKPFDTAQSSWHGFGEYYPLRVNDQDTAAMALYRLYCQNAGCQLNPQDFTSPIAVQWGSRVDPLQSEFTLDGHCVKDAHHMKLIVDMFLSDILWRFRDQRYQPCPYNRTIMASSLTANTPEARTLFKTLLQNKIVLIGAQIHGINDYVKSAVHGQLPGVYFHAMALDNLITLQDSYNRAPAGLLGTDVHIVDITNIILVLLIFLLNYCLNNKKFLYKKANNKRNRLLRKIILTTASLTAIKAWTLLVITVSFTGALFIILFHYEIVNWIGIACIAIGVIDTSAAIEYQKRQQRRV